MCAHGLCVCMHVRERQQAGSADLSRASRAAVTEARVSSWPKSGVLGWSRLRRGRRSCRSSPPVCGGPAVCAPRARAVCSCFMVKGSGGHVHGTSNPWPRLVPSSWVGWEGSGMMLDSTGSRPEGREEPRGSLAGLLWPFVLPVWRAGRVADPCGSQVVLKVRRLGAFLSRQAGYSPGRR